jgi:hypothetical protein
MRTLSSSYHISIYNDNISSFENSLIILLDLKVKTFNIALYEVYILGILQHKLSLFSINPRSYAPRLLYQSPLLKIFGAKNGYAYDNVEYGSTIMMGAISLVLILPERKCDGCYAL